MHNQLAVERYFQHTPPAAVDELLKFRDAHPLRQTTVRGVRWSYLVAGRGPAALLILPGLLGFGEMSFQHIQAFESNYRVVAPNYPFEITTLRELVDGLAALLDAEGIERVHVLGGSYGGMVAQWLVRRYPQRVVSLVLSHTGGPKSDRAATNRRVIALLRLLPMSVFRFMLQGATRKSLKAAPDQIPFWEAYSNEMIARVSKADLIGRYHAAADFDEQSTLTPDDLED
ncbi:MAG: alpha/beta hydrolase [Chloroflexi bacterium]|nr:alpha/beta hydrolase [Chloroflexota bacterium]